MKAKNKAYVEINESNIDEQQKTGHELSVDEQLERLADFLIEFIKQENEKEI